MAKGKAFWRGFVGCLRWLAKRVFNWGVLGFLVIFAAIDLFGRTEFLTYENCVQLFMVAAGGVCIRMDGSGKEL